jgi:DNA-binding transcriptional ArsR family regulator
MPRRTRALTLTEIEGLSHPVRIAALRALAIEPCSPVTVHRETGYRLGTVAYHFRTLLRQGLIRPHHEARRRGAVEHTYQLNDRTAVLAQIRTVIDDLTRLEAAILHGRLGRLLDPEGA